MDAHAQWIRVFPVEGTAAWLDHARLLEGIVVKATRPGLPAFVQGMVRHDFDVEPRSGWIRYALHNDLWGPGPKQSLPPDAASAQAAARGFLDRLAAACREPGFRALDIPPLLPASPLAAIAPVDAVPVPHPARAWIDHWLCRFEVRLQPLPGAERVPVAGSLLDVRVGSRGAVVGFTSRWRPVRLDGVRLSHHFPSPAHHDEDAPQLTYVLEGENAPQTFLAPYHRSGSGEGRVFVPASGHSLLASMAFAQKPEGGALVAPLVLGGSGDHLLRWAYWRPDAYADEGVVALGASDSLELPPGVYNVMLHVEDRTTGAVALCERTAFVKGIPPSDAPQQPPPPT